MHDPCGAPGGPVRLQVLNWRQLQGRAGRDHKKLEQGRAADHFGLSGGWLIMKVYGSIHIPMVTVPSYGQENSNQILKCAIVDTKSAIN